MSDSIGARLTSISARCTNRLCNYIGSTNGVNDVYPKGKTQCPKCGLKTFSHDITDNPIFNIAREIEKRDTRIKELEAKLEQIKNIINSAEELNPYNYDDDQAMALNDAMIEIYDLLNGEKDD